MSLDLIGVDAPDPPTARSLVALIESFPGKTDQGHALVLFDPIVNMGFNSNESKGGLAACLRSILPRPRDLIYFCNAAISTAVNRGHAQVTADDVKTAFETYSQFAFEALLVENGITIHEFRSVLLELLGEPAVVSAEMLKGMITQAAIDPHRADAVIERMQVMSVLGVETRPGKFRFARGVSDLERIQVLARKAAGVNGQRYEIHRAFRSYLEIED